MINFQLKKWLLSEWSRSSHRGEFAIDGWLEETAIALQRAQEDERERRGNRYAAECGTGTWICNFRNLGGSSKMLAQKLRVKRLKNDDVKQIRVHDCFTPNIIIAFFMACFPLYSYINRRLDFLMKLWNLPSIRKCHFEGAWTDVVSLVLIFSYCKILVGWIFYFWASQSTFLWFSLTLFQIADILKLPKYFICPSIPCSYTF